MKKTKFYTLFKEGPVEREGWQEIVHTEQDEDVVINLYNSGDSETPNWCAVEASTGLAAAYGRTRTKALTDAIGKLLTVSKNQNIKVSEFLAKYPKLADKLSAMVGTR